MLPPVTSPPPPALTPLGAATRVLAGVLVLVGGLVGTVLAFSGLGALVDLLVGRGVLVCGESVGCGIGVGFVLVLTGVAVVLLGAVAALVLALALPRHWSTGRALRCAGLVAGAVTLVAAVAMAVVWLAGVGADPPRG